MNSPWTFIAKRFSVPEGAHEGLVARAALSERVEVKDEPKAAMLLDGIGQRDELLRVRMSEMVERLEDLKSLSVDFAEILTPIETISSELPLSKARVLELEVLLDQELESNQTFRREIDGLSSRISALTSELAETQARAARLDGALDERETTIEDLRLSLRERSQFADETERRLLSETEQAEMLRFEVKSLRSEMHVADQALLESDRRLAELGEQRSVAEGEAQRLQRLAEDLNARLVSANVRLDELDQSLEDSVAAATGLEIQLASEQAAHQRAQTQYEAELATARSDYSNLTMKSESLAARQQATDQILAQVRGQLREKEDALRQSERAMKEGLSERQSLDRRLEATRDELARREAVLGERQRAQTELEERCEMLLKALAAKEAALENANAKAQHLGDRVDALTLRYEKERHGLETANRRLLEELQNERAERTLAQGALDIARESRLSLQRQNEALKRAARVRVGAEPGVAEAAMAEPPSNVTPFPAADRSGEDAR